MSVLRTIKRRAVRRALRPTAKAFELLADELSARMPAHTLFTRDDVIELLRNMSETMRSGEIP